MDIDTIGAFAYFFEALGALIAAIALAGAVVMGGVIGFRAIDPSRVSKREVTMRNTTVPSEVEGEVLETEVLSEPDTSSPTKPADVWTKTSSKAGTVKDKKPEPETAGKK